MESFAMPSVRSRTAAIVAAIGLFGIGAAQAQVDVRFTPLSPADAWDARTYRAIWREYGERVVAALEHRTCLPFAEPKVAAVVAEAVSNSGGPEHPMRLRASYARDVKQSTLVHELGHRHLWQLAERLDDIDGHMTLFLVLDLIWADVWGEDFAEARVEGESGWDERYADAWTWARGLTQDERAQFWNELLAMNGFPDGCASHLEPAG
jgi:hypothetical protein